jgi:hypothetical protein
MLHLLLDSEYPHWMMMAGAILVAAGFIGPACEFVRSKVIEPRRFSLFETVDLLWICCG